MFESNNETVGDHRSKVTTPKVGFNLLLGATLFGSPVAAAIASWLAFSGHPAPLNFVLWFGAIPGAIAGFILTFIVVCVPTTYRIPVATFGVLAVSAVVFMYMSNVAQF